jgi:hypothetical protein
MTLATYFGCVGTPGHLNGCFEFGFGQRCIPACVCVVLCSLRCYGGQMLHEVVKPNIERISSCRFNFETAPVIIPRHKE